ncbi:hypothetical protein HBI17_253590 [Parastagonospora nodorum]|nr:hypothetical protein HBI17_253590 [Parastagonospora nodorum]
MHWTAILEHAATQPDGGPRSFPAAEDEHFLRNFSYNPPTSCYQKLLSDQVAMRDFSQRSHSVGWLIPDANANPCKPVIVAPSILSAISLLRQIFPSDTLADEAWRSLVDAARRLAQISEDDMENLEKHASTLALIDQDVAPPSAQRPVAYNSSSLKRRSSLSNSSTSKRARTNTPIRSPSPSSSPRPLTPTCPDQPPASPSASPPASPPASPHNNNRRAEQQRTRKIEARRVRNRLRLGLVEPPAKAAHCERAAYESIEQQDESEVAWILKQKTGEDNDLMTTAANPYTTATGMLEKARAVGNYTTRYHTAAFLSAWRRRGSPFEHAKTGALVASSLAESVDSTVVQPTTSDVVFWNPSSCPIRAVDADFCSAYQLVSYYEYRLAAVHVEYRWAMAFLGRAYANKVASLQGEGVKGNVRSKAITALLHAVTPDNCQPTDSVRGTFKLRLNRATRWYHAANTLGWSCLCLMPENLSCKWVEQTLRIGEWHVWLQLVQRVGPDAYRAIQALDAWLGAEGIAGGPINKKEMLCIEASVPSLATQVEEIRDSEDDDSDGSGPNEDDEEPSQPAAVARSSLPARQLRRVTLTELCQPLV